MNDLVHDAERTRRCLASAAMRMRRQTPRLAGHSWPLALAGVALACAASVLPGALFAQGPAAGIPSSQERLLSLFAKLSPSDDLQITTPVVFIEGADFQSVSPTSVTVLQNGRPTTVNLEDIRAVSVRRAHALQGSLWGLGVGMLLGSVGGMLAGSFGCVTVDDCVNGEREGAMLWGSLLGGAGAATGFVIGRRSVFWKPIFP